LKWEKGWGECFAAPEKAREPKNIKAAYAELMVYLAGAIGASDAHRDMDGSHLLHDLSSMPGGVSGMVSRIENNDAADRQPEVVSITRHSVSTR
jgi:hypothetical protein